MELNRFVDEWSNWSGYFDFYPRQVPPVAGPAEIAQAVAGAVTNARHVRAPGSGWSYSDVALTHDVVIDPARLNHILGLSQGERSWGHADLRGVAHPNLSRVLPHALAAGVLRSQRRFVHLESGVTVRQLYLALDETGLDTPPDTRDPWALPTMGGSGGQTVVGAAATSSHGGDFNLVPPHEAIRAIHLIDGAGGQHWIEGAGARTITDPARLSKALPGVTVHYDDDMLLSAMVAMGCMGVIYSIVMEVVPQYGLTQHGVIADWPAVRDWLRDDGFTSKPLAAAGGQVGPPGRFLEILINPYRDDDRYDTIDPNASRRCLLTFRDFSASFVDDPLPPDGADLSWVSNLLSISLPLTTSQIDLAHQIINFEAGGQSEARGVVDSVLGGVWGSRRQLTTPAKSFQVMDTYDYSTPRKPVQDAEFAVPTTGNQHVALLESLLAAFDDLCRADPDNKFAGGLAVRITLATQAPLGIQQANPVPGFAPGPVPRVCHVEVITVQEVNAVGGHDPADYEGKTELFVARFEKVAAAFEAVRMHWGMTSLTQLHRPDRYGEFATWQAVRTALAGTAGVFDTDFTVRYGISATAPDWPVLSATPYPGSGLKPLDDAVPPCLLPGLPTSHPDDATPAHRFPPTTLLGGTGHVEVFVLGSDGQACWNRQAGPGWYRWLVLPAASAGIPNEARRRLHFLGRIAVATNSDGHPEIFARCGDNGRIHHAWRANVTDQVWQLQEFPDVAWREMDSDSFDSSPDVALDGDDHLHLIARTAGGELMRRCQNPTGWSGWEQLAPKPQGAALAGEPAIVAGAGRTLTVVCRGSDGRMWFSRQQQPHSGASWTGWAHLGLAALTGDPVAVLDPSGVVRVFAAGAAPSGGRALFEIAETVPNTSWEPDWTPVGAGGAPVDDRRVAALVTGGDVQVGYLDAGAAVTHLTRSGGTWAAQSLGGPFTSYPALVRNTDGRLEAFAKFRNDLVQHRRQASPGIW